VTRVLIEVEGEEAIEFIEKIEQLREVLEELREMLKETGVREPQE